MNAHVRLLVGLFWLDPLDFLIFVSIFSPFLLAFEKKLRVIFIIYSGHHLDIKTSYCFYYIRPATLRGGVKKRW